jgi:hypothetical protein
MKTEKVYLDTTLAEVALFYLRKKKLALTTGNLFWTMEKIAKKIDMMNKNTKEKIIKFSDGVCIVSKLFCFEDEQE